MFRPMLALMLGTAVVECTAATAAFVGVLIANGTSSFRIRHRRLIFDIKSSANHVCRLRPKPWKNSQLLEGVLDVEFVEVHRTIVGGDELDHLVEASHLELIRSRSMPEFREEP